MHGSSPRCSGHPRSSPSCPVWLHLATKRHFQTVFFLFGSTQSTPHCKSMSPRCTLSTDSGQRLPIHRLWTQPILHAGVKRPRAGHLYTCAIARCYMRYICLLLLYVFLGPDNKSYTYTHAHKASNSYILIHTPTDLPEAETEGERGAVARRNARVMKN